MNDRMLEMEKFIKYQAKLIKQNPDLVINEDLIYAQLMHYDMSPKEVKNQMVRENFNYWVNKYNGSQNIGVYVAEGQKLFCQFQNMPVNESNINYVKMYLSFGREDMKDCVVKIFDFIAENQILHGSKVSEKQRADSVILRIKNFEDVEKINTFIKNDYELSTKLRKVNPFMFNENGIGYAVDGSVSFNGALATKLADYYNDLKLSNNLNSASIQDFRNYVIRFYNSTFVTCDNLENFMNTELFKDNCVRITKQEDTVSNYAEVFKLLIGSTGKDFNKNDFKNHHQYCNEENRIKGHINFYKSKIDLIKESYKETEIIKTKEQLELEKDIFDAYVIYIIQKYGFEKALALTENYLEIENPNAITRDNDFRNLFAKYVSADAIQNILSGNTLKAYFHKFTQINKIELLDQAAIATCSKYNSEQLHYAINSALNHDNFSRFTEGGNNMYRTKLQEHVTKAGLAEIIKASLSEKGIVCPADDVNFSCYTAYIANKIEELENKAKSI